MKVSRKADLPAPLPGKEGWPWINENTTHLSARHEAAEWPLISIVTPSYNQGQFLEETIRSVLMQGYPNLEYIIIDGGSNDNSVEIIQKYAPFLDYWVSERDRGQANAINKGLVRCTGAIMGWLNSDDLLMPNALFYIAQAFMADPKTTLVCGLRKVIDVDGRFKRNWICDLPTDFYMRKDCVVAQETVYWKRELFEQVGLLDESMHFALDYEYWLRLIQAGNHFRQLPYYIGMFREHETSKSSTLHVVHAANLAIIFERYIPEDNVRLVNGGITLELGLTWLSRYQLIQELCQTHVFDSAYVAIIIIYLLSLPFIQILFTFRFHYLKYKARLQAMGKKRWRTILTALIIATLKSAHWLGKVLWARLRLGKPLCQIDGDAALAHARGLLLLPATVKAGAVQAPVDGIFVRSGWLYLEYNEELVFRWFENNGEIIITSPSGKYNTVYLTVACGPGYHASTLDLQILDAEKQPICERSVEHSGTIAVPVTLTPRQDYVFIVHSKMIAQPLVNDSRILTMNVTRIAWTPPSTPSRIAHRIAQRNIRLEFDQPVDGIGWCVPEQNPHGWTVWTNARESTINVWLIPDSSYDIKFRVIGAIQEDLIKSTICRVNGQIIPLLMKMDDQGAFIFSGTIPDYFVSLEAENTLLTFNIDQVYSPKLLGINDDSRFLGLIFDWLEINPSTSIIAGDSLHRE